MKKLIVSLFSILILCGAATSITGTLSTVFDNFNCAFEKTIETGDSSYFEKFGSETESKLGKVVNNLPFMGTIKKMLSKSGVDQKYINGLDKLNMN